MRKLLLPGLAVAALIIACENKSPAGPGGVGPGGVVVSLTTTTTTTSTTTTIPTSSSTSTTTTSVVGSLSRRYATFGGAPNVPSDMQLFFQLLTSTLAPSSLLEQLPVIGAAFATATEIRYKVTGTYVMPNGTTGTVNGDLFGPLDPLQNGGEFHGVLTATVPGCTAERVFRGPLGPQSMNLLGGEMVRDCAGSPLSFGAVTMTQSNSPPPPTTTSTTSTSTSTSTSTTTTTSVPVCSPFTVSPPGVKIPDTRTVSSLTVTAPSAACSWTAQSLSSWITVTPQAATGNASVQFTAEANTNGPARTGTLLIAGQAVSIEQAAPIPPDLVPVSVPDVGFCASDPKLGAIVRAYTRNVGAGAATVSSFTTLFVNDTQQTLSQPVPTLAPGQQHLSTFDLPDSCGSSCSWRLTVDGTNIVYEGATGADTNNFVDGTCFSDGGIGAITGKVGTIINKR